MKEMKEIKLRTQINSLQGVDENYLYSEPMHPFTLLRIEMKARKMKPAQFKKVFSIKPSAYNSLKNKAAGIDLKLALKLEQFWGISASFWLKLQFAYDLGIAEKTQEFKTVAISYHQQAI